MIGEAYDLGEEFAQAFSGGDIFVLITLPNGTGYLCRPTEGEKMSMEFLDRDEMAAALVEKVYGLAAFRGN